MEKVKIFNTEKYSSIYIAIVSFVGSLFLSFMGISLYFQLIDKVEFNSTIVLVFTCIFIAIFLIFLIPILITRKSYEYYVEDNSIIFKNKDKIFKFEFSKIIRVYSSKSIYYKGVLIEQVEPYLKLTFILNRNNDFISFIKNEVELYKNSNPNVELNVKYIENNNAIIHTLYLILLQVVGIINTAYLDNLHNGINILISVICLIGLLILLIKMIKSNRNIKRQG